MGAHFSGSVANLLDHDDEAGTPDAAISGWLVSEDDPGQSLYLLGSGRLSVVWFLFQLQLYAIHER